MGEGMGVRGWVKGRGREGVVERVLFVEGN